mmetsp:Transcript_20839/g.42909  ORF Transcript_20839/g.42909 Transcript_20839/m.42909 type:complete len:104 (-) Transcript_20839:146-457(-)
MRIPMKMKKIVTSPCRYPDGDDKERLLCIEKLYSCNNPDARKVRTAATFLLQSPDLSAGTYTVRFSSAFTGRFHRVPHVSLKDRDSNNGLQNAGSIRTPPERT